MLGVSNDLNRNQIYQNNRGSALSIPTSAASSYVSDTSYAPTFRRYDGYSSYSSSSKTRKLAVGFASILIPGLGQVINGETSKGIAFFLGSICNYLLFFKNRRNMFMGTVGRIGISAWAAHDAYKRA